MLAWLWMGLAILLEVLGTVNLKLSNGMTRLTPSLLVFFFYGASFLTLSVALKSINISVAYAVWAGLGVALIALIGFIFFGEPLNFWKVVSIALIIAGVIGLNLAGGVH